MSTYQIQRIDDDGRVLFSVTRPLPKAMPTPGQTLIVTSSFMTLKHETYNEGDTLLLIERTQRCTYGGLRTTLGNWLVKGKDGEITVWSGIEMLLTDGWAKISDVEPLDVKSFLG